MSTVEPDLNRHTIDALLRHLPALERPGYSPGVWITPPGGFAYFQYNEDATALLDALHATKLLVVFDWPAWQAEAKRLEREPVALQQADLLTLRKLLTVHVRKERFVEGHLAHVLENGHLAAILHRLQELCPPVER